MESIMIDTHSCPEPEELAALIDGALAEAERQKILAHANNCDLCMELLGDAMHTLDALDEAHPETAEKPAAKARGNVTRFPGVTYLSGAMAVAALLLLTFNLDLFRAGDPVWEVADLNGQQHLRQAAEQLRRNTLLQFRLPVVSDEAVLKHTSNMRDGSEDPGRKDSAFQTSLTKALEAFDQASRKNSDYLPAKRHRLAALLLADRAPDALGSIDPNIDDEAYRHLHALALFQLNDTSGAIAQMEQLPWQTTPDMAYNLARMLIKDEQIDRAKAALRIFLELEPEGSYAREARRYLGE